jgi:recombination associated protein RdgC
MWFRCLSFYRLKADGLNELSTFEEKIQQKPLATCSGLDWFTEGWVRPAKFREELIYASQGFQLISMGREDKVLPSSVIKYFVDAKVGEIEEKESRKIGRKEKLTLKEQVTDDLLPRAFTRFSETMAYIDPNRHWLVINSVTATKTEALVSKIRESIPAFSAVLPRTAIAPKAAMTDWLASGELPGGFEWDADVELRDHDKEGGVIRYSRMELTTEDIRQQVAQGKNVTKLGLIWQERIRFVLTDTLQLTRIQFLDVLQDEVSQSGEDAESVFQATFLIMTNELGQLLDGLLGALGGWVEAQ